MLTPADISGFLTELGLEPTSSDVLHIIDELDWSGSGVVSRSALLMDLLVCSFNCSLTTEFSIAHKAVLRLLSLWSSKTDEACQ